MCRESPYITDPDIVQTTFDFTEEYCLECDRVMQYEVDIGQCILCGGDLPSGTYDNPDGPSVEEWETYFTEEIKRYPCCRLIKK